MQLITQLVHVIPCLWKIIKRPTEYHDIAPQTIRELPPVSLLEPDILDQLFSKSKLRLT
jgi:hypothetical protein